MAPHSSTLAWKIPWTEEPGRLQTMGLWRVRHDWATSFSLFTFMHWRRKWQPTPVFLPGESRDGGAWWATVYGIAQSRTRLKRLSSSSSILYFQLNRNSKPESFKFQTLSSDSLNGGRDFQCCLHEGSDMGTHWRTAGADQEATSPAQPLGEGVITWLWRRENTRVCPGFTV